MEIGKFQKIEGSNCLACDKKLDGVSPVEGEKKPQPGSVSICMYCGNVALFDDNLKLRHPTDEEKVELEKVPELRLAVKVILKLKEKRQNNFH